MVAWALSRAVQLLLGTLYPAYASYKAVRNKDVREYVRWMMYWIVFALFMATETVTDTFFSWFPFYYEIKMAFVVWLLSPYTKGASLLYRKFVHPTLSSKEKEIDHFICQAKERGYESLVSFGKKSINVAATAAIQGQGALAGRLRSFSMQDLRSIPETAMMHYSDPLYLEEQGLCRQPIGRRPGAQQPGSDSEEEEEDCWTDSEVSAPSRGRCRDPALPKPLARSQSFRQAKKRPPPKEVRRQWGGGAGGGEAPGLLRRGGGSPASPSPSPNAAGLLLFADFFSGPPNSFPEAEAGPRALGSSGGAAGKASGRVSTPPALRSLPRARAARPAECGPRRSRCTAAGCRRASPDPALPPRLRAVLARGHEAKLPPGPPPLLTSSNKRLFSARAASSPSLPGGGGGGASARRRNGRRDGGRGAAGAARRERLAGAGGGRLRPRRPRAGAPAGQRLLRGAGGAAQREERGAGDAGGQARVLRELVPAGRPDGAPRDRGGGRAAGGAGGDGAAVPAAHAAGGGGARPRLDPLRLPRPAHRRDAEEPAAGGRGVPAGAVVGPGEPRPAAPLAGHPALNGPGAAVPRQPPPPPRPAAGAALRLGLPEARARLHRQRRLLVGAAGNDRGAASARGDQQPVSLGAGQEASGGRPAAAPEMHGPAGGGRPPPGPTWLAAPWQGSGAKRRHLLQRGGHGRKRRLAAAGAGPTGVAGAGFHLVGSGRRSSEEPGAPKASHRFFSPHLQLASPSRGLRQKWKPPPRPPDVEQVWDASFPNDAILRTPAESKVGREDQAVLAAFGTFTAINT